MSALSVVHEDATVATRAVGNPGDERAEQREITLVLGSREAIRVLPSRFLAVRQPYARRAVSGAIGLATNLVIVAGMLVSGHVAGTPAAGAAGLVLSAGVHGAMPSVWLTSAGAYALGVGGGAGPKVKAPGSAGLPVSGTSSPTLLPQQPPQGIGVSPAPFEPWPPANPWMAVPGTSSFAVQPVPGYYPNSFGQCTWWAQYERQDENLAYMGNASDWAAVAAQRGLHVGDQPAPGATVVFQPGVQGAGGGGHVAHVIAVYPDGWFLISEMNFYWNGGGWGRVDYRYAHSGAGVEFIY
jgi:hypothetical protein